MFRLRFAPGGYASLRRHLLREDSQQEQAAFVFFAIHETQDSGLLMVRDIALLGANDLVSQKNDYLEITNETRSRVIKDAHDGALGIAEFHSHPFNAPAQFSYADYLGLQQTVPHMLWRLKQRPYVAVVVGPYDFDGLVWLPDQSINSLSFILDGEEEFDATKRSLKQWQ